MYRIVLSCKGISESVAKSGVVDIAQEFEERPWHQNVLCSWDGTRVILQADNDYDPSGEALLDEFSDVVCGCIPIETTTISFAIESTGIIVSPVGLGELANPNIT